MNNKLTIRKFVDFIPSYQQFKIIRSLAIPYSQIQELRVTIQQK